MDWRKLFRKKDIDEVVLVPLSIEDNYFDKYEIEENKENIILESSIDEEYYNRVGEITTYSLLGKQKNVSRGIKLF